MPLSLSGGFDFVADLIDLHEFLSIALPLI
jgi:hypothetical protein